MPTWKTAKTMAIQKAVRPRAPGSPCSGGGGRGCNPSRPDIGERGRRTRRTIDVFRPAPLAVNDAANRFDARFYRRYYGNPRTRVVTPAEMARRADLIAAFHAFPLLWNLSGRVEKAFYGLFFGTLFALPQGIFLFNTAPLGALFSNLAATLFSPPLLVCGFLSLFLHPLWEGGAALFFRFAALWAGFIDKAGRALGEEIGMVEDLELPVRASNCLKSAGIHIVGELVQKTEADLLNTKNFGRKSLEDIRRVLESMGLDFGIRVDNFDELYQDWLKRNEEDEA